MSTLGGSRGAPCREMRLLIAACHVGPRPPDPPDGPFDTAQLLRLAAFHRVSGFLHERRANLPLPDDAIDPLRRESRATLHRNLRLALDVKNVLRALHGADIPVMLLKGVYLMDAVYGNPALRPLSDVDLLIHASDLRPALAALDGAGYRADPRRAAFGLSADREVRLVKSGASPVVLDLHADLNRPTRHHGFPMDAMWERSVSVAFEGELARALSPADNLVFLCAHAVPHAFGQLVWLCDIARLLAKTPPALETLVAIARASRTMRATWAGLSLASALLGAPAPRGALEELNSAGKARAGEGLLDPAQLFGGMAYSTVQSLRFRVALADSKGDAAAILSAVLARKAREVARGLARAKAQG